jgi:hypothetical protein
VAWTLFQWWAVIGWPAGLGFGDNAAMASVLVAAVGLVVWRDVYPAAARGAPVPLPDPAAAAPPRAEDLAA